MKIKLQVSGGFIPTIKESVVVENIANNDWDELISTIKVKVNPKARDSKSYMLEANGKEVLINPNLIPKKHKPLFDKLISNLRRSDL